MKIPFFLLVSLLTSAANFAQSPNEKRSAGPLRPVRRCDTGTPDVSAVRAVIAGESAAFYQRNVDKVLSYWANVPYASHSYTEKGMGYLRGYGPVSQAIRKYIDAHPDMGKSSHKIHDFMIHVNGNSALATFITDGLTGTKKSQSYDARYLEKINGAWKLVSVFGTPAP